jgi:hypothetical protein
MKWTFSPGFAMAFLFFAMQTNAATLYMDPNTTELNRGDTLKVSIRLDTDPDECVNVIDGVISYSDNIQVVDISRGASIMSMWVEEPVIDASNHTITFAGGIPNGYCGRIAGDPRLTNVLVDLLVQSPGFVIGSSADTNQAEITFGEQTQILLNDGLGTRADTSLYGATIALSKNAGPSIVNEWGDIVSADEIEPEGFSVVLERTTNAYSNRYFIVFNTTDKQSGIDHYELIEESLSESKLFSWGREDAPWREIKSPYVLKDQSLNSTIRVKAIDKAGNETIAVLLPDEAQRTIPDEVKILFAVIVGLVGVGVIAGIILLVFRRRRSGDDEEYEEEDSEEKEPEEEETT